MKANLNDKRLYLNRLHLYVTELQAIRQTARMKSTSPSLPTSRAFVVQLRADARVEHGEFSGRVEHLVSMRSTRFQSLEELATFLRETILGLEVEEDET
jgi:hypothetical protein